MLAEIGGNGWNQAKLGQSSPQLGDDPRPKKKARPLQRRLAAAFEGDMVDLIDDGAEHVERRQQDDPPDDGGRRRGSCWRCRRGRSRGR